MSTVEYAHITVGPDNVPMLTGTHVKLVEIVLDQPAHGSDAQEIHREFPHLSLGQIYSAPGLLLRPPGRGKRGDFAANGAIRGVRRKFQTIFGPSPLRLKLKAKGLLP